MTQPVAPAGETPPRQIRIGPEWFAFDRAAKSMGTERAPLVRQFIAWYLRETDELPDRPSK